MKKLGLGRRAVEVGVRGTCTRAGGADLLGVHPLKSKSSWAQSSDPTLPPTNKVHWPDCALKALLSFLYNIASLRPGESRGTTSRRRGWGDTVDYVQHIAAKVVRWGQTLRGGLQEGMERRLRDVWVQRSQGWRRVGRLQQAHGWGVERCWPDTKRWRRGEENHGPEADVRRCCRPCQWGRR